MKRFHLRACCESRAVDINNLYYLLFCNGSILEEKTYCFFCLTVRETSQEGNCLSCKGRIWCLSLYLQAFLGKWNVFRVTTNVFRLFLFLSIQWGVSFFSLIITQSQRGLKRFCLCYTLRILVRLPKGLVTCWFLGRESPLHSSPPKSLRREFKVLKFTLLLRRNVNFKL